MWFPLKRTDLSFLAGAPFRYDTTDVFDAPPDVMFDALTRPERMAEWIVGFRRCQWTSPEHGGVGSTRELALASAAFRERFLVWDVGKRFCFAVEALSYPGMLQLVEDAQLEPLAEDQTRLVWSVHYALSLPLRAFHPFIRMNSELLFRKSFKRLASVVRARPA